MKRVRPPQILLEDYFPAQKRARYEGPPLLLEVLPPDMLRLLQPALLSRDRARLRLVCRTLHALDPDFRGPAWMPVLGAWFPPDLRFRARTINTIERLGLLERLAPYHPVVSWCHQYSTCFGIQIQWHFELPQVIGMTDKQVDSVPFHNDGRVRHARVLRTVFTLRHRFRGTWDGESYWELATKDYRANYHAGNRMRVLKVRNPEDGFPYVDQRDVELVAMLPDPGSDDNVHDLLARVGKRCRVPWSRATPFNQRRWTRLHRARRWKRQAILAEEGALDRLLAEVRNIPVKQDTDKSYYYY